MPKTEQYNSTGDHYDGNSARRSAFSNISREHYEVVGTETISDYCEGCNDYHYYCTVTIRINHSAPTDLELKLKEALGR
jgi:hypothetical protein